MTLKMQVLKQELHNVLVIFRSLSTKAAHCEEYAIFSQTSDVESDAGSLFG